MVYATHKAGGALFALAGFEIISKHTNLISPEIAPWLALMLMYPASSFGSTLPDLDHNWSNVKEHTPLNWLINKAIHLTGPRHRSWQTHCWVITAILITLLYVFLGLWRAKGWFDTSQTTISILYLLVTGLSLGITSHLFLDMFTRAGCWLIPGVKVRFVPNDEKFSCSGDSTYEIVWRMILYILDALLLIWILNPFGIQQLIISS